MKKSKIIIFFLIFSFLFFLPLLTLGDSINLNTRTSCFRGQSRIFLYWDLFGENSEYTILRKISQGSFIEIHSTFENSYHDINIDSDKRYTYIIKTTIGGLDYFSEERIVEAIYCPAYLNLINTSCTPEGPSINLNWIGASGNLLNYQIYRNSSMIGSTSDLNFQDSPSIEAGRMYTYFIKTNWTNGAQRDSFYRAAYAPACPAILNLSSACLSESPGGLAINLSWNDLFGDTSYYVERRYGDHRSFLGYVSGLNYTDYLEESLPNYASGGKISYRLITWWPYSSYISYSPYEEIDIVSCPPNLNVQAVCFGPSLLPEMHLSWTPTSGAFRYNIIRGDSVSYQVSGNETSYIDYLDINEDCIGRSCSHNYKIEAVLEGINLESGIITKSIDCVTQKPPSTKPILMASPECENGGSTVNLDWTPSDNVTSYSVFRNGVEEVPLIGTSFIDYNVESNRDYSYHIRAYGVGGEYIESDIKDIKTLTCLSPSVPSLSRSSGCSLGENYVNLSWSPGTIGGPTYFYRLYRGIDMDNLLPIREFNSEITSFRDDVGIDSNIQYYYQIEAIGLPGTDTAKSSIIGSKRDCSLRVPRLYFETMCSSNGAEIKVSWDALNPLNLDTVNYYNLYREDVELPIDSNSGNYAQNYFTDTNLLEETLYTYTIEVFDYTDDPQSQKFSDSVTTDNCGTLGDFEVFLDDTYCEGSYPRAVISWEESSNAQSYNLVRNGTQLSGSINSPFTDGSNNELSSNQNYRWSVRANGPQGTDPIFSNEIGPFLMPICAPSRPSIEQLTASCQGYESDSLVNIRIGWSSTINTNKYEIYRNGSKIKDVFQGDPEFTTRIWNDLGRSQIQTYTYYVKALGEGGENESQPQSILTPDCTAVDPSFPYGPAWVNTPLSCIKIWNEPFYRPQFLVSWGRVEGATGYRVNRNNLEGTGTFFPRDLNSSTFSFTNRSYVYNNVTYIYSVAPTSGTSLGNYTYSEPVLTPEYCRAFVRNFSVKYNCDGTSRVNTLSWNDGREEATSGIMNYFQNTKIRIYETNKWDDSTLEEIDIKKTFVKDENLEFNTREWTDENPNSTNYYFVEAYSPGGSTFIRFTKTHLDCVTPPQAPTLEIENISCTLNYPFVRLRWSGGINAKEYRIYRNSEILTTTSITSFTDNNLENNTDYNYRVRTISPSGEESGLSNEVSVNSSCLPIKPNVITSNNNCSGGIAEINLDWGGDSNTEYWNIWRKRESDPDTSFTLIGVSNINSYKDSSIESEIIYEYYVVAIGVNFNATSDIVKEQSPSCTLQPQTPIIVTLEAQCAGYTSRVFIKWTEDPNDYATGFNVLRKINLSENFNEIYNASRDTTEYLDAEIDKDVKYYYKIEATGVGGNSATSDERDIVTRICESPPRIPYLQTEYAVLTAISIRWKSFGNEKEYEIFRKAPGETSFSLIGTKLPEEGEFFEDQSGSDNVNFVRYVDENGIIDGRTYYYEIKAINDFGSTLSGNILAVYVPIPRPGNFNLSGSRIDGNFFRLNWTAASTTQGGGTVSYELFKGDYSNFELSDGVVIYQGEGLTFDDEFIEKQYYVVRATNLGGSTLSNYVRTGFLLPMWREIAPVQ